MNEHLDLLIAPSRLRQGLNDKAAAIAFARAFDEASGGELSYFSPHLLRKTYLAGDEPGFDGDENSGTSNRSGGRPQEPSLPSIMPSRTSSTSASGSQPGEASKVATISTKAGAGDGARDGAGATSGMNPLPGGDGKNNQRVKVGFLSAHFRWHSVGRLTVGLLERLSHSRGLEIFVIDASIDGRAGTAGRSSHTLQDTPGGDGGHSGDSYGNSVIERLSAAGASIVRLSAAVRDSTAPTPTESEGASQENRKTSASDHAVQNAREAVAALKLDVLVYGDVGMDALTTELAHGRLSPVQVAFWGHPGTTGLSTMDYFITSDLFEGDLRAGPADAQEGRYGGSGNSSSAAVGEEIAKNLADEPGTDDAIAEDEHGNARRSDRQGAFSEQLVRLDGLGVVFDDPTRTFGWDPACGDSNETPGEAVPPREPDGRAGEWPQQNLNGSSGGGGGTYVEHSPRRSTRKGEGSCSPEAAAKNAAVALAANRSRLYVCAQSLAKMHPAFDAALAGVLEADPLAQILLVRDSRQLLWHSRFRRRLRAAIDAAERRAARPPAVAAAPAAALGTAGGANATEVEDPAPPLSPRSGEFWSRVRFVSPLSGREFFRLQCRADVVLDPFPFGGGVTTLEASRSVDGAWLGEIHNLNPPPSASVGPQAGGGTSKKISPLSRSLYGGMSYCHVAPVSLRCVKHPSQNMRSSRRKKHLL